MKKKIQKKLKGRLNEKIYDDIDDEVATTKPQSTSRASICSERVYQETQILSSFDISSCSSPRQEKFLSESKEGQNSIIGEGCDVSYLMFQEAPTESLFRDQESLEFDKFLYDNEELRQVNFEAMSMISEVSQSDCSYLELRGDGNMYDNFYI